MRLHATATPSIWQSRAPPTGDGGIGRLHRLDAHRAGRLHRDWRHLMHRGRDPDGDRITAGNVAVLALMATAIVAWTLIKR